MSNGFYNASGNPGTGAAGASATIRAEFAAIAAGFALLPALSSGVAGRAVVVNAGGTALITTTGTLALGAAFATTGGFGTTLIEQVATQLTLPAASDTLVGRATTDTLTNKTLTSPSLTGTVGLPFTNGRISSTGIGTTGANPTPFMVNGSEVGRFGTDGSLLVGTTTNAGASCLSVANAVLASQVVVGGITPTTDAAIEAIVTGGGGGAYAAYFLNLNSENTGLAHGVQISAGYNGNPGAQTPIFVNFIRPDAGALGSITQNGGSGIAYNTSSDYRLKTVQGPVTNSGAIIDAVPVHSATFTADGAVPSRAMFLAHEVQAQIPTAVIGAKDAVNKKGKPIIQQLDHSALVPILWAEIRELRKRAAVLEGCS